jgi:hypothetical protein
LEDEDMETQRFNEDELCEIGTIRVVVTRAVRSAHKSPIDLSSYTLRNLEEVPEKLMKVLPVKTNVK